MYVMILVSLNWYKCKRGEQTAETIHLIKENRKKIVSLIAYPTIYFVLLLFPLMNRIESGIHREKPNLVLWYLSGIAYPISGGVIGIAYALDRETRRRLTWSHLRAAFQQWTTGGNLKEYPLTYAEGEDGEESAERKPLLTASSTLMNA